MNIVIGPCKCGGYGQVYDDNAEMELGRCHDELGEVMNRGNTGEGEMKLCDCDERPRVAYGARGPIEVEEADVSKQEINSGHYLELMDRLHVINCNLTEHIEQHPLTEKHADLRAMAYAAGSILADMYQRVGELDPE